MGQNSLVHYDDVIMTMLASQITSLTVVYSIVYSGVNQRKHQSSASLAFVREIHRGPVNFPHKWPVTRKMFPFDDVIMPHDNISVPGLSCWNVHSSSCGFFFQYRSRIAMKMKMKIIKKQTIVFSAVWFQIISISYQFEIFSCWITCHYHYVPVPTCDSYFTHDV